MRQRQNAHLVSSPQTSHFFYALYTSYLVPSLCSDRCLFFSYPIHISCDMDDSIDEALARIRAGSAHNDLEYSSRHRLEEDDYLMQRTHNDRYAPPGFNHTTPTPEVWNEQPDEPAFIDAFGKMTSHRYYSD